MGGEHAIDDLKSCHSETSHNELNNSQSEASDEDRNRFMHPLFCHYPQTQVEWLVIQDNKVFDSDLPRPHSNSLLDHREPNHKSMLGKRIHVQQNLPTRGSIEIEVEADKNP